MEYLATDPFLALCAAPHASPPVDVRSPVEFAQGHIPGAVNIPLFSDEERAEIGTLHKRQGSEAAVLRGLECVGQRLGELARRFCALRSGDTAGGAEGTDGAEVALYCDRGRMRSSSVAWLLGTLGREARLLEGGYKAFRRHVLDFFERPLDLLVLGGKTGSGKTRVLNLMAEQGAQVVDLEGLARHRGSAFGALPGHPQPSCEQFENELCLALARMRPDLPVWVEDECENLGKVNLPKPFFRRLRASPLLVLDSPEALRLARVLEEYAALPREDIAHSLDHIKKRLGGLKHSHAHAALASGDMSALAVILLAYYDKAYAKQYEQRTPIAVVRAGSDEEAAARLLAMRVQHTR